MNAMDKMWTNGVVISTGKKITADELREINELIKADGGRSVYLFYREDAETLKDLGDTSSNAGKILPTELPDKAYAQIIDEYEEICGDGDNLVKAMAAEQDAIVRVVNAWT